MVYAFAGYRYDPERGLRGPKGEVPLRQLEGRLLLVLLEADGRLVTKNQVVDSVWNGRPVSDDSIAQSVYRLRNALPTGNGQPIIRTVYGAGFRIAVPIERRDREDAPLQAARPYNRIDAKATLVSARELAGARSPAHLRAAMSAAMRALDLDPCYASAWSALGEFRILLAARSLAPARECGTAAIAAAEAALELDAEWAPALAVRGFVRALIEQDVCRGLADLDRSVSLKPRHWTARLLRGWAFVAAGRVDDAIADLLTAMEINPWSPWCGDAYAQYLWFAGRGEAAWQVVNASAVRFPATDTIHLAASQIASSLGLHDEAIEAGRRAMQLAPDTPALHTALASALAFAGRRNEALQLVQAIEGAGLPLPAARLAPAWLALGERDRARVLLELSREQGEPQFAYALHDPRLAELRGVMPTFAMAA
jgi:DNA-binding winged helix-turn-helix (wHTH) protein/Flp pilus assembly protein TadD